MTPFSLRDRARLWLARARGQDMLSPRLDPVVVRRGGYPGSGGEHRLQKAMGTQRRAVRFYDRQMLDHLSPPMVEFIARMDIMFVSTADAQGECDCSIRTGPRGFLRVLDERSVAWPEFNGNGVMASMGNILENPHAGLLMVDFTGSTMGLHVNGKASVHEQIEGLDAPEEAGGKHAIRWVRVDIEEAYIHCSKHVPLMERKDKTLDWGTSNPFRKGGDFFAAVGRERPWKKDE